MITKKSLLIFVKAFFFYFALTIKILYLNYKKRLEKKSPKEMGSICCTNYNNSPENNDQLVLKVFIFKVRNITILSL